MGTVQQACGDTACRRPLSKTCGREVLRVGRVLRVEEREAVREPKYKTTNNKKPKWEQSLCYSWRSRGEKKEQSLLTCTIKASFARRKCSSLFLVGTKG